MNKDIRKYIIQIWETEYDREEGLCVELESIGLKYSVDYCHSLIKNNESVELIEEYTEDSILTFSWEYRENGNKYKEFEYYTEEAKEVA